MTLRATVLSVVTLVGGLAVSTALAGRSMPVPQGVRPADPRQAQGLIIGRVVDAATNRPIARAVVSLAGGQSATVTDAAVNLAAPTPVGSARVFTDSEGRYLFRNLAAGAYTLSAVAPGFLDGAYGQRRPGGAAQPFVLSDNQRAGDIGIRLWEEATLAGRITDDIGAPVAGVWVTLLNRDQVSEGGRATAIRSTFTLQARTDDRGQYRFSRLLPGAYLAVVASRMTEWSGSLVAMDAAALQQVRATGITVLATNSAAVRVGDVSVQTAGDGLLGGNNILAGILPTSVRADGRVMAYPSTFHPSATSIAAATVVTIGFGDDRSNIDIVVRPMPLIPLYGKVIGPNGPLPNFAVHLVPAYAANQMLERAHETAVTMSDASGAFRFLGVPPGPYVLKAWSLTQVLVIGRDAMPADTTLWAELPVTVGDAALKDLAVTLRPGSTVSGRLKFEGTTTPPAPGTLQTPLSVAFEPPWSLAFGARLAVRVTPTWEFVTQGLPPGKYVPVLPNQFSVRGWYFESAIRNGKDLFVDPLVLDGTAVTDVEVTYSDRRSEIAGTVVDAYGKPDSAAAVVIFPSDYRAWIQNGASPFAGRAILASQTGQYALPMKPGTYLAAAIREELLARWSDPATIEAVAGTATRVTVVRGESVRLDLKRGAR